MRTKTEATIKDLYHVPEDRKAEIVNGEVVLMPPTGKKPNRAGFKICLRLYKHELKTGSGIAVSDNAGFSVNLPIRKSFSPDAAFYVGKDTGMKFFFKARQCLRLKCAAKMILARRRSATLETK